MARLIVFPGTAQARQVVLRHGINNVGRGPTNDVTLEDGSVSGSHCQFIVSDDAVVIRDVGSTNGTFVNGAPVVSETSLQTGHQIQLGSVPLLFEADDISPSSPLPGVPASPTLPSADLTPPPSPPARLRVALQASHAPARAEVVEEPVLVSDEEPTPAAVPMSQAQCKYHPRTSARWICTRCQKAFCDLCVTTRGGTSEKFCRSCATACVPLQIVAETRKEKTFFSELPRAVVYPFRGSGVVIMICATIVFAALGFMSRGILSFFMKMLVIGYFFAFVQSIIHTTAVGDDKMPPLPGMEGLFANFFRLVGTLLMSFGPALVAAYFAIWQEMPGAGVALIPTVLFGCLYFPMAFLAVAMKDNVLASNPLVVVPSILRVPLEYIVTTILLAAVFGMRWLGDAISSEMGGQALMTTSMSEMFLLFGLRMIWAFISVYLLTVTMRILGILYLTKRDRLGW